MEKVSKKKKRPAAVCVTVPHRALTAPRRVASLKSWLTPTCSTGGDADWSTPPATPAIGTTIKLSENFPRYIVRTSPTPTSVPCRGPIQRGEESGIRWSLEEGREREREREKERDTSERWTLLPGFQQNIFTNDWTRWDCSSLQGTG